MSNMTSRFFYCFIFAGYLSSFSANAQMNCLPSCEVDDGRMIILVPADVDLSTLSGEPVRATLIADSGSGQLEFGVFDPDHGGLWDSTSPGTAPLATNSRVSYAVYADPDKTGNSAGLGTPLIQIFSDDDNPGPDCDDNDMDPTNDCVNPWDNRWRDVMQPHVPSAFDGNTYNYLFEAIVLAPDPAPDDARRSAFRFRANGELFLTPNAGLSLVGNLFASPPILSTTEILPIVFPFFEVPACLVLDQNGMSAPDTSGCGMPAQDGPNCCACFFEGGFDVCANENYDGNFVIPVLVDVSPGEIVNELTIWDGDLDFGDGPDCLLDQNPLDDPCGSGPDDTDDPDTQPGARPVFGVSGFANDEGEVPRGNPPENPPGDQPFLVRGGAVTYELVHPDSGTSYENLNPSGDEEWERFTIRLNSHPGGCDNTVADFCVDAIPDGVWEIRVTGLDFSNLDFFGVEFTTMMAPPDEDVAPVPALSRWGMVVMILLFGMVGYLKFRKRRV